MHVYMGEGDHRGNKQLSGPFRTMVTGGVRCLMWVIGTELGSAARPAMALNT